MSDEQQMRSGSPSSCKTVRLLDALRGLLKHRTEDLGCYEFVLEAWIESAADEIERLRLTDEEQEAIEAAVGEAEAHQHARRAWALRKLLERLA